MSQAETNTATLYRMATCPHGLKAKDLLKNHGHTVVDHLFENQYAVDSFKAEHGVSTTPQVFIGGTRIGGFDDLSAHFGVAVEHNSEVSYQPVIALFSVSALLACAVTWLVLGSVLSTQTIGWFIAIAMVLLGLQKLQDLDTFATLFRSYDLLAQRWPHYGRLYPFVETGAGLLMLMGALTWLAAPAALIISSIGAYSVYKAVYIEQRTLQCACVGDARVPLGFISLTENLMMMAMSIWMLWRL